MEHLPGGSLADKLKLGPLVQRQAELVEPVMERINAVIETMRGHRLGRVIWKGTAAPNTGIPGDVCGETSRRG